MADYDYVNPTGYDYWGDAGVLATKTDKHFIWKRTIEMSVAGDALSSTGAFANTDTMKIFDVLEGMLINYVAVEVTTVEGATATIEIGDDTDENGFIMAADLEVAGWYQPDTTYAGKYLGNDTATYYLGKLYAAADTIDIYFNNDIDDAIIDVWVGGIYFSPIYVA